MGSWQQGVFSCLMASHMLFLVYNFNPGKDACGHFLFTFKTLSMKRLQYTIDIKAPAAKTAGVMLGKDTFKLWTSVFNPTSDFEGGWNKGDKIYFIGTGADGRQAGMVAEIAEHIPGRFVSIRHYGIYNNGQEITEGPDVEKWAGGLENYTYEEKDGTTTVTVDVDVTEDNIDYFNSTYPKALEKLKTLCEA